MSVRQIAYLRYFNGRMQFLAILLDPMAFRKASFFGFVSIGILGCSLGIGMYLTYSERPEVILLHTQKSEYPDFAFRISSIPLAVATFLKSGHRAFSVLPATRQNIESSLANAKVVIVGTHGVGGGIFTDEGGWIGPDGIINSSMRLIYFGSCYFGEKRNQWIAKFPNAKVIGYDQLTHPSVGWRYLVFQAWRDLFNLNWDEQ